MRMLRPAALAALAILVLSCVAVPALSVTFHGNVKSGVFHRPGCRYYDCKNCVAVFSSREEALKAGYRPCGTCNP